MKRILVAFFTLLLGFAGYAFLFNPAIGANLVLILTDGVHTIIGVQKITVTGGTVGGSGRDATVTISGSSGANPTATIGTAAVNGSAPTFMRSDAAPPIPQCSSSSFGACKVDGTTITASSGVISARSALSGMSAGQIPVAASSTTVAGSIQPPAAINAKDFGAICDGGSHPLSGFYGSLGAAQVKYPFVTSLTQQIDYAALKLMSNTALGADGSEHGTTSPQLNQPMFIPSGICNLGSDIWNIKNADGMQLWGAGSTATVITGSGDAVLQFDGLWYSSLRDFTVRQLSSANTTALDVDGNTRGVVAGNSSTYGTICASTGLFYFEADLNNSGAVGIGVGNTSSDTSISKFIGGDTNSVGFYGAHLFYNGGQVAAYAFLWAAPIHADVAVDLNHHKLWIRQQGAGWNNDILTNQNPATNTGGYTLDPSVYASPVCPGTTLGGGGQETIGYFSAASWQDTPPSGFGTFGTSEAWDATRADTNITISPVACGSATCSEVLYAVYPTIGVQADSFYNLTVNGGGALQAVSVCRIGGNGGQCSEMTWENLHAQNASFAVYLQNGFNALDNIFSGGDLQNYSKHGMYIEFGSVKILGMSFESETGYNQIANGGCDITDTAGGVGDSIQVLGSRTESMCFINIAGGVRSDLHGISQNIAAYNAWSPGFAFPLHTIVSGTDSGGASHIFYVSTAGGPSGGTEPTWPSSGTVTDGGVVWTEFDNPAITVLQGTYDDASGGIDANSSAAVKAGRLRIGGGYNVQALTDMNGDNAGEFCVGGSSSSAKTVCLYRNPLGSSETLGAGVALPPGVGLIAAPDADLSLNAKAIDVNGPAILQPATVAALPTCSSGWSGYSIFVTDATDPGRRVAVTTGGGHGVDAQCLTLDGATYVWVAK